MHRSIALTGFMGTGKDSIGRAIARRSDLTFVSTDRFVELQAGATITDIFKNEGEDTFREYEEKALARIAPLPNTVIATGGGIVLRSNNRAIMKRHNTVVHLCAPLDVLQKRLTDSTDRPLANNHDQIARVFSDREGMYDHADVKVNTAEYCPEEIAEQLITDLQLAAREPAILPVTVPVQSESATYPVVYGSGLLSDATLFQKYMRTANQVCIVTNPLVGALYLEPLLAMFADQDVTVVQVIMPDSEETKTLTSARILYDRLIKERFSRSDMLISLGGGVLSDLTGFVAATYKRGTGCMFIPTTLLGQIDAAIGGKNGVNHEQGKNMIGTFYQPDLVIGDMETLRTLPEDEFCNGLAEMIKYGVTCDPDLFVVLEQHTDEIIARDLARLLKVISTCVRIKGSIVARDERESRGIRQILNFGHTIGHAIETVLKYTGVSHGQAVATGMVVEGKAAVDHGYLDTHTYDRIVGLIDRYQLPVSLPDGVTMDAVRELVSQDKKVRSSTICLPIVHAIGECTIKEVSCTTYW